MNALNNLNKSLYNIFYNIFELIDTFKFNINYNDTIILILLFCINNIYYLNKIVYLLENINYIYNNYTIIQLNKINKKINTLEIQILNEYNKLSIDNNYKNIYINLIKKNKKKQILKDYTKNNLELYDLNNLELILTENNLNNSDNLFNPEIINYKNNNYNGIQKINIGYNNYYYLHSFKYLNNELPINLLMYIQEIDQIVIKVGYDGKYKYINSRLYSVYNNYQFGNTHYRENNLDKYKSIICNNNIKELNKKCYNTNCKYYHDYIIGYSDNSDNYRVFSSNPIVYNCLNFKDGSAVSTNIKKIKWYDAINVYQSSLSNILIACVHSQN